MLPAKTFWIKVSILISSGSLSNFVSIFGKTSNAAAFSCLLIPSNMSLNPISCRHCSRRSNKLWGVYMKAQLAQITKSEGCITGAKQGCYLRIVITPYIVGSFLKRCKWARYIVSKVAALCFESSWWPCHSSAISVKSDKFLSSKSIQYFCSFGSLKSVVSGL